MGFIYIYIYIYIVKETKRILKPPDLWILESLREKKTWGKFGRKRK